MTFAPSGGFRFRHILIRDAAYDALPKATRAAMHEQLAGWLAESAGSDRREVDELIGWHLERAYLLGRASSARPTTGWAGARTNR